jgi:hypothetical protein
MTHIPDGSNIDYDTRPKGLESPSHFSWGWLGDSVPTAGWDDPVIKDLFLKKVASLEVTNRYRGSHTCEVCGHGRFSNGTRSIEHEGTHYAAPAGVAHYIEEHDYRPPEQVIVAMLAKP